MILKNITSFICLVAMSGNMMAMDAIRYMPSNSKIREYCQQHSSEQSCGVLATYLKAMETSQNRHQEINSIDKKIATLEALNHSVESQEKFRPYYEGKKEKFVTQKNEIINQGILLPSNFPEGDSLEKSSYETAVKNILNNIDSQFHEKEYGYLKMAFSNAWYHKHPGNTLTSSEKYSNAVQFALATAAVVGLSVLAYKYSIRF